MARDPENNQEAPGATGAARAQEIPCDAVAAGPTGSSGQAAQTPEQARVRRLNRIGIPAAVAPEAAWSADLFAPTTKDMGVGHPRNGVSPW